MYQLKSYFYLYCFETLNEPTSNCILWTYRVTPFTHRFTAHRLQSKILISKSSSNWYLGCYQLNGVLFYVEVRSQLLTDVAVLEVIDRKMLLKSNLLKKRFITVIHKHNTDQIGHVQDVVLKHFQFFTKTILKRFYIQVFFFFFITALIR